MTTSRDVRGGESWRKRGVILAAGLLLLPALASAQDSGLPRAVATRSVEKKEPKVTEMLPVTALEAERVAETLKAIFGLPQGGGPYIEAVPLRNALLVRGSAEQVQDITGVLRVLGETGEKAPTLRIITLERGSAATLAEALQSMMGQMRNNPVKVITPGRQPSEPARPETPVKPEPGKKEPQADKSQPVTITAFGNRMIVTSDDPQAVALAVELVRLLQQPVAEGDFEVFRLKHAQAVNLARVLDEAFNGAKPARPGMIVPERVRVVADPATNSLLVKASPLDTLTIRNLLSRHLDIPEAKKAPEGPQGGIRQVPGRGEE
jgi:type II secretory pathway component GspD/PulD (secretin)